MYDSVAPHEAKLPEKWDELKGLDRSVSQSVSQCENEL